MAKFECMIPHLIRWEAGVMQRDGETIPQLFDRARAKGFSNHPDDKGGPTMTGVTLNTYRAYCKVEGLAAPDVTALKAIPLEHWYNIAKKKFWNCCLADHIISQGVAEMLVDWAYNAGVKNAVKGVQRVVDVKEDGVMGNLTLAAVNAFNSYTLFGRLKAARLAYYDNIVKHNPLQAGFLDGWRNRTNSIIYK
jgi:lysozyme family protein